MISVLLIWGFILVTTWILGFTVLGVITSLPFINKANNGNRYCVSKHTSFILAGLVTANIYAEIYSLFSGVDKFAVLGLILICLILCIIQSQKIISSLQSLFIYSGKMFWGRLCITAAIVVLFSIGTAQGYWHIDTPLYHAQSIHWIETYGVVPGLGNLQSHFAYNNSCFCLYALYAFTFISGQSFHVVQGFLAMIAAIICLLPSKYSDTSKTHLALFGKVVTVGYLFTIFDELVSPAADYYFTILIFLVVVLWMELLDKKEASFVPYALISMLAVYIITVKLAAAPLLLLALLPITILIKNCKKNPNVKYKSQEEFLKNRKSSVYSIVFFIVIGFIIAIPYFVRTVILSGWLMYPLAQIDLFNFEWQIPEGVAMFEQREISITGREIYDLSVESTPLSMWFGIWFARLRGPMKILFAAAAVAVPVWAVLILFRKKLKISPKLIHLALVIVVGFLFWFNTTPQIRFGISYIWTLDALTYGTILIVLLGEKKNFLSNIPDLAAKVAILLPLAGMLYRVYAQRDMVKEVVVVQQDYERFECGTYEIDGIEFYYPIGDVRAGYYAFPATRWQVEGVHALGDLVEDGFAVDKQ
ncbi:MAG: hypothetical protein K6A23_06725 [Butyrivibrio sp.]|nr:hypothetical protein [Butyrivibrio sp.]